MLSAITTTLNRMPALASALMALAVLSFVCHPETLGHQTARASSEVPLSIGPRAPVVEPDPTADNLVRGVTSQVTIDTPVAEPHAGHLHHR